MDCSPEKCLRLFEQFDLTDFYESRLATYALEDYYTSVLSNVGGEYLDFDTDLQDQNIGPQWNVAKRRLTSVEVVNDIPSNYSRAIHQLSRTRQSVAHGYDHRPDNRHLMEAYEIAVDWREWLTEKAKQYHRLESDTVSREVLITDTINALNASLVDPEKYDYDFIRVKQREINDEIRDKLEYEFTPFTVDDMAIQLRSSVDEVDEFYPHEDSREVQRELWHLFEWAMEMKRSVDNLYYTDVNRIERKVAVKTATHGGMCSVVHEYDESTGEIQLMVHEAENKKEHTWCEVDLLPEDDRTILLQKSVGETVEAILGVGESGEWYVRHVVS
ncbi:hypothetical protein C2R22_04985 [Salinigranum rubrum]|uniref:Uncharacterized protein n=1 Tax=Salinigranum rubrum TaxID=755307 RepID=A0A2I8VGN1_9EURY|nr:hypothetical protein [Salinigranum rubrum]AUV81093.1 hypothetical protein C2R22_04985 [Salinigranum rubrum]